MTNRMPISRRKKSYSKKSKPLRQGERGSQIKVDSPGKAKLKNPSAGVFEKVYEVVLRIPPGKVMTYGQIARLLGDRYSPRLIGWAMHATPDDGRKIPWHRVINTKGGISTGRIIVHEPDLQMWMLESEGILFNKDGLCDLRLYQWFPDKKNPERIS